VPAFCSLVAPEWLHGLSNLKSRDRDRWAGSISLLLNVYDWLPALVAGLSTTGVCASDCGSNDSNLTQTHCETAIIAKARRPNIDHSVSLRSRPSGS
jgi:hypothetical protein